MNERDNPSMKYYLAPMEGLTGYIYRNAYHACYHAMDKYFTPFLSPKANSKLSFRELNDILPEHNQGMYVVPQILTNQAGDFIQTAKELQEYGYSEINLNRAVHQAPWYPNRRGPVSWGGRTAWTGFWTRCAGRWMRWAWRCL